jgi:hypothetical protein
MVTMHKGLSVSRMTEGPFTVDGRECTQFDIYDRNDDVLVSVYLDTESHLPVKAAYKIVLRYGELPGLSTKYERKNIRTVETYYEDWREVDGVRYPASRRLVVPGKTGEELRFKVMRIEINPPDGMQHFAPWESGAANP